MGRIVSLLVLATSLVVFGQERSSEGILLLVHGGSAEWNQRVEELTRAIDPVQPVEVAFGMASRPTIQSAIDRLVARGVQSIVAVPLFVSSHSSVVRSTAYLLGLQREMPPDLRIFAKMSHGPASSATAAGHAGHAGHAASDAPDNTAPVNTPVRIRMTDALNRHPLVGDILIDRAREVSTTPEKEAVIVVAHGPVPDSDNALWLKDMHVIAQQMDAVTDFGTFDVMTVRDDAPAAIRDAATADLRRLVSSYLTAGRRVLIVPLLLSYGGIEKGIRQRLGGLDYVMANRALLPDARLAEWVRQSAAK